MWSIGKIYRTPSRVPPTGVLFCLIISYVFLIFIFAPIFFLILFLNDYRKKKDKKEISDHLALPIGLFVVMCIVAYKMNMAFAETSIILFFGYTIGELTATILDN
jgi:3-deoxy-D-manno-octulosonic-acid transferase